MVVCDPKVCLKLHCTARDTDCVFSVTADQKWCFCGFFCFFLVRLDTRPHSVCLVLDDALLSLCKSHYAVLHVMMILQLQTKMNYYSCTIREERLRPSLGSGSTPPPPHTHTSPCTRGTYGPMTSVEDQKRQPIWWYWQIKRTTLFKVCAN